MEEIRVQNLTWVTKKDHLRARKISFNPPKIIRACTSTEMLRCNKRKNKGGARKKGRRKKRGRKEKPWNAAGAWDRALHSPLSQWGECHRCSAVWSGWK